MANVQVIGLGDDEARKLLSRIKTILISLGFNDESAIVSAIHHAHYAREEQKERIHLIGYSMLNDDAHVWPEDAFPENISYSVIDSEAETTGPAVRHAPYFSVFAETPERIEEIVAHMKAHGVGMDTEKHLIRPNVEDLEYPCIRVLSDIPTELPMIIDALKGMAFRIYNKSITFTPGSEML